MELKVVKAPGQDPFSAVKMAVIMSLIGNGKMYELLHKQIWRKDKSRLGLYDHPLYRTHNGRPVKFVSHWNIKSPSTAPYSYTNNYEFGLNQLFVGQSPYEPYQGNVKDGIYHDDCYITPKMMQLDSGEIYAWAIGPKYVWHDEDAPRYAHIYRDKDSLGNTLITNVEYVRYTAVVNNITNYKHKVVITTPTGSRTIELGTDPAIGGGFTEWELKPLQPVREYTGIIESWQKDHATVIAELVAQNGPIVSQTVEPNNTWLNPFRDGALIMFRNGVLVEYVPWNTDDGVSVPAHYKVLPMIYTDTGDLVMSRAVFVDKWDEYFELVVHEDSEWWESFVPVIAAIVTIVIAAYTGLNLGGWETFAGSAAFIGGGLSAIGILSGSKELTLAGGILAGIGGLTGALNAGAELGIKAVGEDYLMRQGIGMSAADMLAGASVGELFEYFISGVGLENLVNVGSSVMKVFSGIQGLGVDGEQQTMTEVMEDAGKTVIPADEEEEVLDAVMNLVNI